MIEGVVNAAREAVVTLPLRGPAGQAPLAGMSLLDDHDLRIQVRDGGRVIIQAVP